MNWWHQLVCNMCTQMLYIQLYHAEFKRVEASAPGKMPPVAILI